MQNHANVQTTRARRTMRVLAVILAGGATLAFAGDCNDAFDIEPFLLEGDAAPGSGANFETFDRPNLSSAGHIAFSGDTDGDTSSDDVVYVDDNLIAQQGALAPGTKGGEYSSFEFFETAHQVNANGDVVYIATLTNLPTDENRAVYRNDVLIAQEGSTPPGIIDRLFADFGYAGIADDGTVGFLGDLAGDTADDSIIVYGDGVLYREEDEVPGMKGVIWDGNFDELQWNGNGDLIFEGNTSLAGGDMVVFRRRNVGKAIIEDIVAQEDQPVDAHTGPDTLELILQLALAENGDWLVRGNLGVAPSDFDAVILDADGVVAQQGDDVPEFDEKDVVLGNFNGASINSLGDVLYLADLEGQTPPDVDEGIFLNGCLLVTTGMQVPGQPGGVIFTDLGFEDMYINDDRMIVFAATYTGGDGLFTIDLGEDGIPGDLDDDGDVDFDDFTQLLANFGNPGCGGALPCPADIDSDGDVDFDDFTTLLANWTG